MPPARALVDAGAAIALATDFNPGSAFCESLPLVCSLAATQLKLSPAEALAACTVNAAHVLGRAGTHRPHLARLRGRPDPSRRSRLALPRLPPRRRRRRRRGQGRRGRLQPRGILSDAVARSSSAAAQKLKRHEYEEVYVDEEGRELDPEEAEELVAASPAKRTGSRRRPSRRAAVAADRAAVVAAHGQAGLLFFPLMLLTVFLLAGDDVTTLQKIVQTLALMAFFLPFSYFMDTMRLALAPAAARERRRPKKKS